MPAADSVLGRPLVGAGGTLGEFPFIAEQVLKVVVVPLDGVGGPCALEPAGERVVAFAGAKGILPAEALLFDGGSLRFGTDILDLLGSAMGFAERVSAGDQGHRLLIIHRHAAEGLADIPCRRDGIRLSIGPFRIHVNQAHLNRGERILEVAIAAVALVGQPLALRPPVNVFFRLPDVLAPTAETEGLESHRLQSDVSGEDHQVGPGYFAAVLLLDRQEQPACFVEAHVVRPAVEGRKPLCSGTRAAPTVGDTVRAGAMPCHTDEERPIMAVVRGPPVLR